jgi:uncharacterized membrane protein
MAPQDLGTLFVYVGAYDGEEPALADFAAIKDAKFAQLIGKYQSAVFSKHADGEVEVLAADSTTRAFGAKWGAAVGAVASLLFPAALVVGIPAGTASGAVAGNVGRGWFASDIQDLTDALLAGHFGVIVIAQARPDMAVEQLLGNAIRTDRKPIDHADRDLMTALDAIA